MSKIIKDVQGEDGFWYFVEVEETEEDIKDSEENIKHSESCIKPPIFSKESYKMTYDDLSYEEQEEINQSRKNHINTLIKSKSINGFIISIEHEYKTEFIITIQYNNIKKSYLHYNINNNNESIKMMQEFDELNQTEQLYHIFNQIYTPNQPILIEKGEYDLFFD